ncbi:hypothetical protein ZYGR_0A04340 [Zygosaccharomyces rouxii]|uniref:CID domain-containing protein n=1 Tax=Zygosaccharomyces rouxii TaxID=4956 RepID=A0A1Q2ZTI7_ZYGRO|nr:hypothetical protein ZYGR_0A04340 [Zygosaccharomyces rouxii]
MDKEAEIVVKDFTSILEELTFNSRPIITTLTKIAEENIPCAQYFVDALEAKLERCPPKQKLCAFYALDSICKNAGSPYTIYFSRNLFSLYRRTYLLVDNTTRTKLINMFKTWMVPNESTGGYSPLFEKTALEKIEQFLIKASALHQKNFQSMLPTPTVPLLMREIDKLTALSTERLRAQPQDEKLNMKLVVLSQLKQELQREKLTAGALKQLQMQLRQIFAQDQQTLQDRQRHQQQEQFVQQQQQQLQQQQHQQQQQQHQNQNQNQQQNTLYGQSVIPLFGDSSNIGRGVSSLFGGPQSILSPLNFSEFDRQSKKTKLQELYQSLDEEGLVYKPPKESIVTLCSRLGADQNGLGTHQQQTHKPLPPMDFLHGILADCKASFATVHVDILNTPNLQLSQQVISNENPIVNNCLVHLLYRAKPNKCNVCGKRFGNDVEEKRLQAEHLDWHFRIHKRMKGSEGTVILGTGLGGTAAQKNIQSRNWYLHDSQWVNFKDEEIVSTNRTTDESLTLANLDAQSTNAQSSVPVEEIKSPETVAVDESILRKKYVVVPELAEDMSFQCPICKDAVTGLYDEDLGEWVWKNSMEANGKYFHATCYYEAVKNNSGSNVVQLDLEKLKHLVSG